MSSIENSESQNAQSQEQALKIYKVNFKLINQQKLSLDITSNDSLAEVRQFLNDSSEMHLYTSFHFEANNCVLNEYVEFSNLDQDDVANITVKLDAYNERTARLHATRVQDILTKPEQISSLLGNFSQGNQNKKNKTITNEKQDEPKKNMTMNGIIKPSLNNYKLCQRKIKENLQENFSCLNFLNFSGYNPPPTYRKIQDDFFYLYARTLEGNDLHITACPTGFYVNNSNLRVLDPSKASNAQVYVSLIDLLKHHSAIFSKNFDFLLQLEPSSEIQESPNQTTHRFGTDWLYIQERVKPHGWNLNRSEKSVNDLHGIDPSIISDWNEDLQICKDLPRDSFFPRVNRDKALIRTHNDFLEASIKGAKAVVDNNIVAINPMDTKQQQVFVYNHIFFSIAMETADSFKQEAGQETSPTVSTSNCDIRNLRLLHQMNIPGLYMLNTCLVDYKGYRIIAQSIIPGILSNDQSNCTQYGSIDEGKTIHYNEEFHELMKQVAENFMLENEIICLDEEGKQYKIAGGLEVKGILGSDKRKYILDLMRLSPRDLNYPQVLDENLCCVIRYELIENFNMMKNFEYSSQKLQEEIEKEKKEKEATNEQEIKEDPESLKKQQMDKFIRFQEILQATKNDSANTTVYNSNIESRANILPSTNLDKQKESLQELSRSIVKKAIPNLVNEFMNDQSGRLADSRSVADMFHQHGVNMRYLGQVIEQITSKDHSHLKIILERIILVKSVKHVLREQMRNCNSQQLPHVIAHVLNCILSSNEQKSLLDKKQVVFETLSEQDIQLINRQDQQQSIQQTKKNKKSQTKNNLSQQKGTDFTSTVEQKISIKKSQSLELTPSQFWEQICHIAQKRYSYKLASKSEDFQGFKLKFNKLAALRDICLNVGIQLECKDYILFHEETEKKSQKNKEQETPSYAKLPFNYSNIRNIQPITKHIEVINEDAKNHMDIAEKYYQEGKGTEALELYQTTLQILLNLYGPLHKDIASCYTKIAQIYYKIGEVDQALFYQKQTYLTYEKLYGLDHYQTAHSLLYLGLFYFGAKLYEKGAKYMLKSLYLQNLIGGEAYPDISMALMNLSMLYQQSGQHQAALSCLFESLERNKLLFGEKSIRVGGCYQAIALVHYEIEDIKKALEYQERCVAILAENLKEDDQRLAEAKLYARNLGQLLEEKKQKSQLQMNLESKRSFGTNKPIKQNQENDQQMYQKNNEEAQFKSKERDILLEKLRIAKYNAKYGRRPNNFDMNKLIYEQMQQQQEQSQHQQQQQ